MSEQNKRGGARKGAGRPKVPTKMLRIDAEVYLMAEHLNELFCPATSTRVFIEQLIADKYKQSFDSQGIIKPQV